MDEFIWRDGPFEYLVRPTEMIDDGGGIFFRSGGERFPVGQYHQRNIGNEILRLAERVRELEAELERWRGFVGNRDIHINQARQRLRIECDELGDNDWPDNLHLADVIEKHLARPAAARIEELEEDLSVARMASQSRVDGVADRANAKIFALEEENARLRAVNQEMAATCQHSDMVATHEGPLDV